MRTNRGVGACAEQPPIGGVAGIVRAERDHRLGLVAAHELAHRAPATTGGVAAHDKEEAFKRLKHRLHLEAVSGLSQHALLVDVAAKVLADNMPR